MTVENELDLGLLNKEIKALQEKIVKFNEERDKAIGAISKQDFFFFENKPNVVFDKVTGLLWPNMHTFPYNEGMEGSDEGCYLVNEDENELSDKGFFEEDYEIDGIGGWRYPKQKEIVIFARNKANPFIKTEDLSYGFYISGKRGAQVDLPEGEYYYDEDDEDGAYFLPCSSALTDNTRYKVLRAGQEDILTPEARAELLLDFYLEYNLLPSLNDKTITYFNDYQNVVTWQQELDALVDTKQNLLDTDGQGSQNIIGREKTSLVNIQSLLKSYNSESIANSSFQYYKALQEVTKELETKLDEFLWENNALYDTYRNLLGDMEAVKIEDSSLIMGELLARREILQEGLSDDVMLTYDHLDKIRQQADTWQHKLSRLHKADDYLAELQKLEKLPRPSFSLVVEHSTALVNGAIDKINFFSSHEQELTQLVELSKEWEENALGYFNGDFYAELQDHAHLDSEQIWDFQNAWEEDHYDSEAALNDLLEGLFDGSLAFLLEKQELLEQVLQALTHYRSNVDRFYLEEWLELQKTYANSVGGDLKKELEVFIRMSEYAGEFQQELQKVIFSLSDLAARRALQRWADENILDFIFENLLHWYADCEDMDKKLLLKLRQLYRKGFSICLNNDQAYSEIMLARYKEYGRLVLEIRDDLLEKI